jgi:hypothetical protein
MAWWRDGVLKDERMVREFEDRSGLSANEELQRWLVELE